MDASSHCNKEDFHQTVAKNTWTKQLKTPLRHLCTFSINEKSINPQKDLITPLSFDKLATNTVMSSWQLGINLSNPWYGYVVMMFN